MEGSGKIFLGPRSLHINHGCPSPLCLSHSFCQRSCTTRERQLPFSSSSTPFSGRATGRTSKWNKWPRDVSLKSHSGALQVRCFMLCKTLCRHTLQCMKVAPSQGTNCALSIWHIECWCIIKKCTEQKKGQSAIIYIYIANNVSFPLYNCFSDSLHVCSSNTSYFVIN